MDDNDVVDMDKEDANRLVDANHAIAKKLDEIQSKTSEELEKRDAERGLKLDAYHSEAKDAAKKHLRLSRAVLIIVTLIFLIVVAFSVTFWKYAIIVTTH